MRALRRSPTRAPTLAPQVQDDMRRVFDTGYFTSVAPTAEDTRDGVRLTVALTAYPTLRGAVVTGADALPVRVLEDAFRGMVSGEEGEAERGAVRWWRRAPKPDPTTRALTPGRLGAPSTTANSRAPWTP